MQKVTLYLHLIYLVVGCDVGPGSDVQSYRKANARPLYHDVPLREFSLAVEVLTKRRASKYSEFTLVTESQAYRGVAEGSPVGVECDVSDHDTLGRFEERIENLRRSDECQ